MKSKNILLAVFLFSCLLSQEASILPAQKSAISSLATSAGFSSENLKRYLDSLPKTLYYNDHQPSSISWTDKIIKKL